MGKEKGLFSFAHVTDLHYQDEGNQAIPKANDRVKCLIEDINRERNSPIPDFVVISGDVSERGSGRKEDLVAAKRICDTLEAPYFVVAGNHDLAPNREIHYPEKEEYHEGPLQTSNYGCVFGTQGLCFSYCKENIHLLGVTLRDGDPDGMLDWLEEELASTPLKKVLVTHYGLYPPRDAGMLSKWGFNRIAKILPRLRSLVENSRGNVLAYLYGHNHINSVIKRDNIYHISSGGVQLGCTGYRLFEVYEGKIVSKFYLLSDKDLLDFNYWGRSNPEICVDSTHPTVEIYHRGTEEETCFSIER